MINQLQKDKLKKFEKFIKDFTNQKRCQVCDIHQLRLNCRELYSIFDDAEPFYTEIADKFKKIIKITNQIRDLDVFISKYQTFLINSQVSKLQKERKKGIKNLHKYLKDINVNKSFKIYKRSFDITDKKQLHKYRIFIKKLLYKEKNNPQNDIFKIELLTKVKNILGSINDNYNALKMLDELAISNSELKKGIYEKNKQLFKEFIYLYSHYLS